MTGRGKPPAVLIAPLGSKPQLVTLAIDLLLEREVALEEMVVIHTCPRRPADSRNSFESSRAPAEAGE